MNFFKKIALFIYNKFKKQDIKPSPILCLPHLKEDNESSSENNTGKRICFDEMHRVTQSLDDFEVDMTDIINSSLPSSSRGLGFAVIFMTQNSCDFIVNKNFDFKVTHQYLPKSPRWNHLLNFFVINGYTRGQPITSLANDIKKYKDLFKKYQISPDVYYKKGLSQLKLDILETIAKHDTDKYLKKHFSKKHKYLITEKFNNLIKDLILDKDTLDDISSLIKSNIYSYKEPSQLYTDVINLLNKNRNWDVISQITKIKEFGTVLFKNDNRIVFETKSYDQIKELGAPKWCIVKRKGDFYSHISVGDRQFVIYNFNVPYNSSEAIIGITFNENQETVRHAFDYNNRPYTIEKKDLHFLP
jgi:hypothetical protein